MKAISLWQPWAQLVAIREKAVETRCWATSHRGELAIHATQGMPPEARRFCRENAFAREVLGRWGFEEAGAGSAILPRSAIVAVVEVLDCFEITSDFLLGERLVGETHKLSARERAFGIYTLGRFGWRLGNVRKLDRPILARGRQRIWNVDRETERKVRDELGALE